MIITLTPNPSLDQTVTLRRLVRGGVLRAHDSQLHPGGKGVNVSRALATHGDKTTALLCTGGAPGSQIVDLLDAEGIAARSVSIPGETRTNITIAEPDGVTTKINLAGPEWTGGEAELLIEALRATGTQDAEWVAGCGSLPPGADADTFARIVTTARDAGMAVAVDSSGDALLRAIDAGPDLVKPNRAELVECSGVAVDTLGDAVTAARRLRDRGARSVLTSLGADGAVLVDSAGVLHGEAPAGTPRSNVGAGDALLAGFLAAGGSGKHAFAQAIAWGTAATQLEGSRMPHPRDVARVDVTIHNTIDPERLLHHEADVES